MLLMLMLELLILALAAAVFAPHTPLGKSLRAALIDTPAKALARATPLKIVTGLIVAVILVAILLSAPEYFAIMGGADLWVYFDITVVTMLVSSAVRLKSGALHIIRVSHAMAGVAARATRMRGRSRHLRPRRAKPAPASDEGEPQWDWAIA
jgi:hypothetical protein